MVDSNVIFSANLIRNSTMANIVSHVIKNHSMVLCQYVIDEVIVAYTKKFPHKFDEIVGYLDDLPFELFVLTDYDERKYPDNRDRKDIPILANAIESGVDIFITGDKDFDDVNIAKPRILKSQQYVKEFMT